VKRLMVLGAISALLVGFDRVLSPRRPKRHASSDGALNPSFVTLQDVLEHHRALPPKARAFYEAVLAQGDVLALRVDYLPDPLLWLTTTGDQARWMREQHNGSGGMKSVVMSVAEAHDLLTATGTKAPTTLREIAQVLLSRAPAEIQSPADDS
jgi:hypothetical protein